MLQKLNKEKLNCTILSRSERFVNQTKNKLHHIEPLRDICMSGNSHGNRWGCTQAWIIIILYLYFNLCLYRHCNLYFYMYLHLPVAGQERKAEGDRSSGDEDAVEDRQHCQDLSKCQLWNKVMILLIVMLLLMMMIMTFKMLKFSRLLHSAAVGEEGEKTASQMKNKVKWVD